MKWVISKDDFQGTVDPKSSRPTQGQLILFGSPVLGKDPDSKTMSNNDIEECFKVYSAEDELQEAIHDKRRFHVWVTYLVENGYSLKLQRDYMIFCGGWLQFWDLNVSTEEKERMIYFDWGKDGRSVVVYISNATKQNGYQVCVTVIPPGPSKDPPAVPPPPPPGA